VSVEDHAVRAAFHIACIGGPRIHGSQGSACGDIICRVRRQQVPFLGSELSDFF
jgi:hypothetical protein